jgi:hypothetical protein
MLRDRSTQRKLVEDALEDGRCQQLMAEWLLNEIARERLEARMFVDDATYLAEALVSDDENMRRTTNLFMRDPDLRAELRDIIQRDPAVRAYLWHKLKEDMKVEVRHEIRGRQKRKSARMD